MFIYINEVNLLRVNNILHENLIPDIELDYYIPITIEFKANDCPTKDFYYYRIINEDFSFVEFKINSKLKKIYSIVLVSINGIKKYSLNQSDISDIPLACGNPIINTDIWNETTIITQESNFIIMYNGEKLFIYPKDISLVKNRIAMHSVELLISGNKEIIGLIFFNIPNENRQEFEECINSRKATS